MITQFLASPFRSIPSRFLSDFSLSESISRLRDNTIRPSWHYPEKEVVIGYVNERKVQLGRFTPLFYNSFRPVFIGRFSEKSSHVALEGKFTIGLLSKAVIAVWLGGILLGTLIVALMCLGILDADKPASRPPAYIVLIPMAFFFGGIAFFNFCRWLSRKDIPAVSAVIEEALTAKDGKNKDKQIVFAKEKMFIHFLFSW